MTGLAGIDGHEDDATLLRPPAHRLPERLVGIVVAPDGRPVGLDLPSLDVRGAAEAWRAVLGRGPYFVHFADRAVVPDVARVQRLARLGEVWLDGALQDVDAGLDLLIAGAARLVVIGTDAELLDAIGDSAVVAWNGSRPLEDAIAAAAPYHAPILAMVAAPRQDVPGLYQAPPAPWNGRFEVLFVGTPADEDEE